MKYLLALLSCCLLFACETTEQRTEATDGTTLEKPMPNSNNEGAERDQKFQEFLEEIDALTPPFQYLTCRNGTENCEVYGEHRPIPYFEGYTYVRGKFDLPKGNVGVISLQGADCMLPVVTTFNPKGKRIAEGIITIGRCGPGPCFECTDYTVIRADRSIYFADTVITMDCDDEFEPIPGTTVKKVWYQEGKIEDDGKISISEDLEKILEQD